MAAILFRSLTHLLFVIDQREYNGVLKQNNE